MNRRPGVQRYRSLIFALLLCACGGAVWAMIAWPHSFAVQLIAVAAVLAAAKAGQSPALRRQRPPAAPGAAAPTAPPADGPAWLFRAAVAVTAVCSLGGLASIWFMAATLTHGGPSKVAPALFVGFLFVGGLASSYLAQRSARLAAAAPRRGSRRRVLWILTALTALFTVGWLAALRSWLGAVAHGGHGAMAMDLFVVFLFASIVTSAYLTMRLWSRT